MHLISQAECVSYLEIRWIPLKSHKMDICHLSNLLLHMRVWETSLRGEVSKGKRALVFQMNPARLEPEGFLQSLTPKNLFLVLKAAAAAENSASAFSGAIACAGHAVAPTSSTTGPSVQSGEGPGTHTHSFPKPKGEKLISLTQEWGCCPKSLPNDAASSMRQKQDGLRMTGHSKKEGQTPSKHCWPLQQQKCCSCAQPYAPWPEPSHQS